MDTPVDALSQKQTVRLGASTASTIAVCAIAGTTAGTSAGPANRRRTGQAAYGMDALDRRRSPIGLLKPFV